MLVNDENKFAFVCIAKAASTSIRKRFGLVATAENPDPPPYLSHVFKGHNQTKAGSKGVF